jgi:hypothetical protein
MDAGGSAEEVIIYDMLGEEGLNRSLTNAASKGELERVQQFIALGADVNHADAWVGHTI